MSSKRRTGFSEGKGAIPVDLFLETLLAHGFFDHVHFTAEQSGKVLLKVFEPAEIVKTATRKTLSQTDCDIDVGGIGLPAGCGAKQGHTHYSNGAELLFMLL
jgi:hypothetical protein